MRSSMRCMDKTSSLDTLTWVRASPLPTLANSLSPAVRVVHISLRPTGNGPIAALLPFEDWARFAIAQRTHYNYVEISAFVTGLILATAQDKPVLAGSGGLAFLLGRALYSSGYKKQGPKGRNIGAIISDLAIVVLLGGAVHSALSHSGAISAVAKLFK